jgi:hypothetical protein
VVFSGSQISYLPATTVIPVTGTATGDGLRLSGPAQIDQTTFGVETTDVTNWTTTLNGTDMVGQFQATSCFYPGFGFDFFASAPTFS